MIAKEFKPKIKGKSDFYSWQLYRWIMKYPRRTTIWSAPDGLLYIGDQRDGKWIHAARLRALCSFGAKLEAWAFGPDFDTVNWVDVTDQFWSDYKRIGVCAIHGDFAHKWIVSGDTRTCEHCGKVERKETEVRQVEVWKTA